MQIVVKCTTTNTGSCLCNLKGCLNGLDICTFKNSSINIGNGGLAKSHLGCLDHLKSISEI